MSQPLPLSPPLPSLDGRLPVPRERAADAGERSAQRHVFGRLLDRFAQSDRGQDPTKDPVTAPQDQRPRERCSTDDDSRRPLEDAATTDTETADPIAMPAAPIHDTAAPADPAKPALDPVQAPSIPAPTPIAVEVPTIVPIAAAAPAETASATTEAVPTVSTAAAMPAVAAAAAMVANGPAPVAGTPAATAAAKPVVVPDEAAAETAALEPAMDTLDLGQAGVNVDSGNLSFSLRQQQGNGQNGGGAFDANAAHAAFGDGGEPATSDEPLGQVIRDGILSIRVQDRTDPMDIASTLSTLTGSATTSSTAASKATADYNSFLTLLTAQLKFQDPLAPLDATEFVSQLSQFSSVEQAIVANQKLDQIINSLDANSMMADVGLIGHKVELAGDAVELHDGSASLTYSLAKDAEQAGVVIRDESGNIVRSMAVDNSAGEHSLTWDGTDNSGSDLPDGIYSFTFGAADADGKVVASTSCVTAMVTRVETTADGSELVLSNGMHTASSAVRAILSA